MRRLFLLCTTLLISTSVFGQSSSNHYLHYQAAVYDSLDNLLVHQQIGVQISILKDLEGGSAVFVERHNGKTNGNGLLHLEIGSGTSIEGQFDTIDWSTGSFFVKSELDLGGGTNYVVTGTRELHTIPYAIHAKTTLETDPRFTDSPAGGITAMDTAYWNSKLDAASPAGGITAMDTAYWNSKLDAASPAGGITAMDTAYWNSKLDAASPAGGITAMDTAYWNSKLDAASPAGGITAMDTAYWNTRQNQLIAGRKITISADTIHFSSGPAHYVGELYGGGIVFWVDHTGDHGLIASLDSVGKCRWVTMEENEYFPNGLIQSLWNGKEMTSKIVNYDGVLTSAAHVCTAYENEDHGTGIFSDWYLPAIYEFVLLNKNYYQVQKSLIQNNYDSFSKYLATERFWTSVYIDYQSGLYFGVEENYFNDFWGPNAKYAERPVLPIRAF